ncbi:hypothetical protein AB0C07_23445 [Actinoplanes missouriensis]|uniref:hypothetical protein n=1 Tax=Actinoplanes missouriensis TaxID=1866 RepID=UPI0033D33DF3
MGHSICALIVGEPFDEGAAHQWDVVGLPVGESLRLVHISHYYTAYMQRCRGETATLDVPASFPDPFPREAVVASLAAALAADLPGEKAPAFALVMTDYFGGTGEQWACVYIAGRRVETVSDINAALRVLGVQAAEGLDEFDTVGLAHHRTTPDYLDRYEALCDKLGQ